MTTEMVLLEAQLALARVRDNEVMMWIILVLLIAALALWFTYILDRWSWIPRKRHTRTFYERF